MTDETEPYPDTRFQVFPDNYLIFLGITIRLPLTVVNVPRRGGVTGQTRLVGVVRIVVESSVDSGNLPVSPGPPSTRSETSKKS